MRLLDLFCGAGGAAVGYARAGFEVLGVDIQEQSNYPFEFAQADALEILENEDSLKGFDVIHASPPCHDHSRSRNSAGLDGSGWMLGATLDALKAYDRPWIVENVEGAPMPSAVELCGASFGLGASGMDLPRHRWFQTSFPLMVPPCSHRPGKTMGVYGHGTNAWHRKKLGRNLTVAEMKEAMGIDWMTRDELTQAIPPAFTEWIGKQLIEQLEQVPA